MKMLLIALVLVFVGCSQASSELDNVKKLALASNELALKIHKTFNSRGNIFYSPASISIALGMLYEGARGITAEEMHRTLFYGIYGVSQQNVGLYYQELLSRMENSSDEYKLSIANAIVSRAEYPMLEKYKESVIKHYGSAVKEADFTRETIKVLEDINHWVSNKTEGKIRALLTSLDPNVVLIILNAVYFKGTWKTQFDPRYTAKEPFYNDGGSATHVRMMKMENFFLYQEFEGIGVEALKIPYKGEDISMLILLPFERNGVSKVEQELTVVKLNDIMSGMSEHEVVVEIPKFKLKDSRKLKKPLRRLGMKRAFTNGANFAGITRGQNVKISSIVHKARIDVNEEGSEAAGATAIWAMLRSANRPKFFRADHPFIFFIRDERSGMILFSGRVNNL